MKAAAGSYGYKNDGGFVVDGRIDGDSGWGEAILWIVLMCIWRARSGFVTTKTTPGKQWPVKVPARCLHGFVRTRKSSVAWNVELC